MLPVDRLALADRRIVVGVTNSNMMGAMLPSTSILLMNMGFPELQNGIAHFGKDIVVVSLEMALYFCIAVG
ncbi:MAG: hypothetical protein Q4D19_06495 [Lautropia sp.]|nr:hypothetical protein [Lautropia sp.]